METFPLGGRNGKNLPLMGKDFSEIKSRREYLLLFYVHRFLRHIAVKKVTILYNIYKKRAQKSLLKI